MSGTNPYVVGSGTRLALTPVDGALPVVGFQGAEMPLLGEHSRGRYTRPHLRGHRAGGGGWSTRFRPVSETVDGGCYLLRAEDPAAGLELAYEIEPVPGGGLRCRCTVTNTATDEYVVEGLEIVLPLPDDHVEVLDLTGRHERERTPQRHAITDGLWLREGRGGRPGLDAATLVVAGTPGFSTTHGHVIGVHVGWSGSSVLRVERSAAEGATIGGGELLLPGEVRLSAGASYASPWVYVAASDAGLDGLAESWHGYQRSLAAHPDVQPVVLNVWEAVYFDHDLDRLKEIAERAARVGVERFVLDDGWFHDRRDDTAGLGDWVVDPAVWPDGLDPLIEHVTGLGMEFGLWFEPEMVNPDSDLFREHPDWILSAGGRVPLEHRNQQVLDLTRPEVLDHLFERVDAVLSAHDIRYVKWDHNRDLLEAGSGARGGAPAVHEQTLAFYALLDRLRAAHPDGRVGVVRLRRWADRPRRARARAAGLGLRHDRRAGAPADPAVDHPAGRAGVRRRARLRAHLAHHRPHPVAGLPLRDGAVRGVRDRVGPDHGVRVGAGRAGVVGGALQAVPAAAALRPRRATRVQRPGGPAARRRRSLRGTRSRTCSWTSRPTTEACRCACPASSPTRRTPSPGRDRSPRRRRACRCDRLVGGPQRVSR